MALLQCVSGRLGCSWIPAHLTWTFCQPAVSPGLFELPLLHFCLGEMLPHHHRDPCPQNILKLRGICSLALLVYAPQESFSGGFVFCAVAMEPCTLAPPAAHSTLCLNSSRHPLLDSGHWGIWLQVTDLLWLLASKVSAVAGIPFFFVCVSSLLVVSVEHSPKPCQSSSHKALWLTRPSP